MGIIPTPTIRIVLTATAQPMRTGPTHIAHTGIRRHQRPHPLSVVVAVVAAAVEVPLAAGDPELAAGRHAFGVRTAFVRQLCGLSGPATLCPLGHAVVCVAYSCGGVASLQRSRTRGALPPSRRPIL
eukprot:4935626-Prymnesium_polylepis.1